MELQERTLIVDEEESNMKGNFIKTFVGQTH